MSIEVQLALAQQLHRLTGEALEGLKTELDAAVAREEQASGARCAEHDCDHPDQYRRQGMGGADPTCMKCGCTLKEA